ncbi:MAG: oxygenase MpaB family protein, partial [Pseudonocardiaceae bacterium]
MSTDAERTQQRPDDPELFKNGPLRLATRLWSPGDLRADPAQLRRLREFAHAGDPLADDAVAMFGA